MNTATTASSKAAPGRLGRFELRRVLGKGAQATVWLAFDPRLEREVAVKLLRMDADSAALSQWLHEARAVSRMAHPHIVPLFEADEQQGRAYLVFEYVKGATLSEHLRSKGSLPARDAVQMLLGVLEALRAAHGMGIVHRDLKPSNILVDADGRARVMDFGIAARITDVGDGGIVGTPGYMSPEAARGGAPSPSMDVFAAGMMLGEMLAGKPLLRDSDPYRTIQRVQDEDVVLPDMGSRVDDGLRAIVMRAVARDPQQRYPSVDALHQALCKWMDPDTITLADPGAAGNGGGAGTLEFLLRRMRHKSDFPAMSDSVSRIQRVANSEKESLSNLSNEILKDVALTNKLLRMVNTAHFSSAGGGTISTVSRAVALVGFAGIRNMALSLVLLEHMQDKGHASQLKEEFLRALMAGSLANELCPTARDGEEAFIGSMFQNLGRLLTEYYFAEEAQQIRQQLKPAPGRTEAPSEDRVSTKVLGISFEELGIGVAKSWGLPDSLQKTMRRPVGEPPPKPVERGTERLRWIGHAANAVADAMLQTPPDQLADKLGQIAARYAKSLGVSEKEMRDAADQARDKLTQLAQAMNIQVAPASPARRLMSMVQPELAPDHDTLSPMALQATLPMGADKTANVYVPGPGEDKTIVLAPRPEKVAELLAAGIQDITNHMVADNFKLNEVLRMILETMFRALDFHRVVFCLRDPRTEMLTGRFGLGQGVEAVSPVFKVALKLQAGTGADLFTAVCLKGADTLIADTSASNIAARLPAWYREKVNAPAFLLLPLLMKNAPFALIYADKARAGGIELGEKELSLLRTLRNQAVMAFRQAS
ncbi:protein kinase domain-containing protein [Ideonella sp. BN130291]|uniref:protein kinase domain-containing protein n=1 Tax=Ideonella sp. BN130291 TaxID=3112940 RepID=UPI002E2541C2|nr:protein kinase [Ideonella sp. BN130291]